MWYIFAYRVVSAHLTMMWRKPKRWKFAGIIYQSRDAVETNVSICMISLFLVFCLSNYFICAKYIFRSSVEYSRWYSIWSCKKSQTEGYAADQVKKKKKQDEIACLVKSLFLCITSEQALSSVEKYSLIVINTFLNH